MTEIDYLELVKSCFCTNTRILSRKITRIYDTYLAPSGININQLSILLTIQGMNQRDDERATAAEVADYLGIDTSSMSRSLRNLEKQRIIKVVGSTINRRKKHIEITEYGGKVLMEAFPYWQEAQNSIRRKLGTELFETMIDLLTQISPELDSEMS